MILAVQRAMIMHKLCIKEKFVDNRWNILFCSCSEFDKSNRWRRPSSNVWLFGREAWI